MTSKFVAPGWPIDEQSQRFVYDEVTQHIFNEETNQATTKRLDTNDLQEFDEIIAISEETLNTTLRFRYSNLLKKKKDKRLREFNHAISKFGEIKAQMAAPHLQLVVNEFGGQTVRFFINFKSGTYDWWLGSSPIDAEKYSQRLDGWSVALDVNFSDEKLSEVPQQIQNKISLLKPGTYSVSQILLGLSAASLASINMAASNFPNTPNPDTKKDIYTVALSDFKRYFAVYIDWLGRGPYSVLGYTIKVDETIDNRLPPEFRPTKVRVRTQAYSPNTQAYKDHFPITKRPIRGGLDALMFQQMTGKNDWPKVIYDDRKAANWVTGNVDCSLTLSKGVFWDRYLRDKFSEFNLKALTIANDIYWWIRTEQKVFNNPWVLSPEGKPSEAKWNGTPKGAEFAWSKPMIKEVEKNYAYDRHYTNIRNYVNWEPGTDVVEIYMSIFSQRNYESPKVQYHNAVELRWLLKLRLNTIKDGELTTVISYDPPKITSHQHEHAQWFHMDEGDMRKMEVETENKVREMLDKHAIDKHLTAILNETGKFVFPGAGEFAMRDPKFNTRGDLNVTLSLQGGGIIVDDDFHLQVDAKGHPCHGKWVKVARDEDGSDLVLVGDQSQATLFQLSNGNLVVDVNGMPAGQSASTRPPDEKPEGQKWNVQDIFFDTPETAKTKTGDKLEFSTTGSGFFFTPNQGTSWWSRFVLQGDKLKLYIGNPSPYDDPTPDDPFMLSAIY